MSQDKLIVITRSDLSAGYQGTQGIHAAIGFIFKFPFLSYRWYKNSNYLAFLSVQTEAGLMVLIHKLEQEGIRHYIFREPDINNQITAIAVEPSERAKRLCSGIPLALKSAGINKHQPT